MTPAVVRRLSVACAALLLLGGQAAPRVEQAPPGALPLLRFAAPRETLRLAVTGDTGATRDRLRGALQRLHAARPIDAIILLGDNFYPCGVRSISDRQWEKVTLHFVPIGIPIFPVLGNHDYGEEEECAGARPGAQVEASAKVPRWLFPARSYEVSTPLADLFLIDTEPVAGAWTKSSSGSQTAAEIVSALERSLAASKSPVRIVGGHHPLYSSGPHGRARGPNLFSMRTRVGPLLEKYGVTLYMCGHDHILELIGDVAKPPLFLVSGAGSALTDYAPRRGSDELPSIFPTPMPKRAFYGFAMVEVTRTNVTITMHDEAGDVLGKPFSVRVRAR